MVSSCKDEALSDIEEEEEQEELSNAEQMLAEINLARTALASGEDEWISYLEEVVEPTLVIFFGDEFRDKMIELFGHDYYTEIRNAYQDGRLPGSSSYPSIPVGEFSRIEPVTFNARLSSGAEKWTNYFIENEVQNLHADFAGEINVSEPDEKGNAECVAPKHTHYRSARNIIVAFIVDPGVASRGHRIAIFNRRFKSAGGYFDDEVGGGTVRFKR